MNMYTNFEVFAILKYVVIKLRIFSPVARQPALPLHVVGTPNVGGLKPVAATEDGQT